MQSDERTKDGTRRLCNAVYGRDERARDYLGGADARMLHDAATEIERLRSIVDRLKREAAHIGDAIEWGGGANDWVHRSDPHMTLSMSLIAAEGEREAAGAAAKEGDS